MDSYEMLEDIRSQVMAKPKVVEAVFNTSVITMFSGITDPFFVWDRWPAEQELFKRYRQLLEDTVASYLQASDSERSNFVTRYKEVRRIFDEYYDADDVAGLDHFLVDELAAKIFSTLMIFDHRAESHRGSGALVFGGLVHNCFCWGMYDEGEPAFGSPSAGFPEQIQDDPRIFKVIQDMRDALALAESGTYYKIGEAKIWNRDIFGLPRSTALRKEHGTRFGSPSPTPAIERGIDFGTLD